VAIPGTSSGNEEVTMDRMSIGEFARASRLSPKALRLYDELDLLRPAHVDASSGYRFYEASQLESARLVVALRQLEMPLAEISVILDLSAPDAARHIAGYWASVEGSHTERRELATYLVDRLNGKRSVMDNVISHTLPTRHLLCLKRNVNDNQAVWDLGKEFIGIMRARPIPRLGGQEGASFLIYHGEVNADSDGPVEWCHPLPEDDPEAVAAQYPELTLRDEPAHSEVWMAVGPGGQVAPAQWEIAIETLLQWAADHGRTPSHHGVRIIYEFPAAGSAVGSGPDCSFAVPLA
jgi:DNA-binding transcriptional MerR regulator